MNLSQHSHIKVSELMQGKKSTVLMHADKHYLLSITRRGKLILTAAKESSTSDNKVPSGDIRLMVS